MARSIWEGEISFGLVSIPVSLVSVEEKNDIHFHLLDAKTRSRVKYQRVSEETGKEVPWADIVKGYEYDKDSYIIVDESSFEKASPELFKTIEIDEFVDMKEIDSLYYVKPYYLVPESKNKKAYVLLREALKKTRKVGVAKVIIRKKESLSLILPHENALLLYLVHFSDEIRQEDEISLPKDPAKAYKIADKELKMAEALINEMSTKWQPEKYHNEYRDALREWLDQQVEKKAKKSPQKTKSSVNEGSVVDFISLLKESMKKNKPAPKKTVRNRKT
ncbi:Ku protein [Legionella dresdenensis]|uniref:Non-homologous end joining protein Ku n=1 Tax=Legionella dresdenensis TaxID=450200 RepID=A0ABV8CE20_9GAMM